MNFKKRNSRVVNFTVPTVHRVKIKESQKRDMYLDLAREPKKLLDMKLTVILIVIGILEKGPQRLTRGLMEL